MKDGRAIGILAVLAVVAYGLSKTKPPAVEASAVLPKAGIPPTSGITTVETTKESYSGAPGEIAPRINTVEDFATVYGMSVNAATKTAQRYADNPNDPEFATLTSRDKENLATIVTAETFTATALQFDKVAATSGGVTSPTYQAAVDSAYQAAATQVAETGGVVSWSSDGGYQATSWADLGPEYY